MKNIQCTLSVAMVVFLCTFAANAQNMRMRTYCNPINVDYTYMIYNSDRDISYRSGADPAVVEFRGEYYMFVTRSLGPISTGDHQTYTYQRSAAG